MAEPLGRRLLNVAEDARRELEYERRHGVLQRLHVLPIYREQPRPLQVGAHREAQLGRQQRVQRGRGSGSAGCG